VPESVLGECYQSILKISEAQSPDAKRAILALAEIFQDNSGRRSYDSQPLLLQNVRAPDRQRIPSDRLRSRRAARPGLPASVTREAIWPIVDRSRSDNTIMHCKDDFSDHMTIG
jgi:hypothetical protein